VAKSGRRGRSAAGAFFELSQRAGRIASRARSGIAARAHLMQII
jgi:hypothetical protein